MLVPNDVHLVQRVNEIEKLVQDEVWGKANPERHLTFHGTREAKAIRIFLQAISEHLPKNEVLNEAEIFTLSAASILCNIGFQIPDLGTIGLDSSVQYQEEERELIWIKHPELSSQMLQSSSFREPGYPNLGFYDDDPYLYPILLLCRYHERADLFFDDEEAQGEWSSSQWSLYSQFWPDIGHLRMDLLGALFQFSNLVCLNLQRLRSERLMTAPLSSQYRWWPYNFYRGANINPEFEIQLSFRVPKRYSMIKDYVRTVVENRIRNLYNLHFETFRKYNLNPTMAKDVLILETHSSPTLPEEIVERFQAQPDQLIPTHPVRPGPVSLDQRSSDVPDPPNQVNSSNNEKTNNTDLKILHQLLITHFDQEELRTLCFYLDIVFDDLRGEGKAGKARELLQFVVRHGLIKQLKRELIRMRPNVLWPDMSEGNQRNEFNDSKSSTVPLDVGALLSKHAPRYKVVEILSTHLVSNSFVYKAEDNHLLKRLVVIKEPAFFYERQNLPDDEFDKLYQRFKREQYILVKVDHPYIAQLYDLVDERYLVQEWIEGQSLREIIRQQVKISIDQVIRIGIEACEALGYAYDEYQIVHRDIKPDHIFLRNNDHICIIDFGLAQAYESISSHTNITGKKPIFGTLAYMAPEQARTGMIDHRADIFALGVTLYEVLTGKRPYQRGAWQTEFYTEGKIPTPKSISEFRSNVPKSLDKVLFKAIELEPNNRYEVWEGFRRSLQSIKLDFK